MKKIIIIFSLIGLLVAIFFPLMEEFISYEETAGYCENCFRPFWNYISNRGWFVICIYSFIGAIIGGITGFSLYELKRFLVKH